MSGRKKVSTTTAANADVQSSADRMRELKQERNAVAAELAQSLVESGSGEARATLESEQSSEPKFTQAMCDVLNAHQSVVIDEELHEVLGDGEFVLAAVCYAMTPAWRESKDRHGHPLLRTLWPLPLFQFEPTPDDRRWDLIRAAALLLAEVERMDALAPTQPVPA